jgi:hypothetical protein
MENTNTKTKDTKTKDTKTKDTKTKDTNEGCDCDTDKGGDTRDPDKGGSAKGTFKGVDRWACGICNRAFSSKRALRTHLGKGVCLGKGFICLRCWKLWGTASELQRHQSAKKKCKKKGGCNLTRKRDGTIEVDRF